MARLLLVSLQAQAIQRIPFIWFWPEGSPSCAIVTHDVEELAGRDFCTTLMDLNDSAGIKSSFQIVPEERYPVPESFLDEIRQRGFEVNIHDLNHDGNLYREREIFLQRAQRINQYGKKFRAVGFRSGALYRNADWYGALDFSYDLSVPNVGHLEAQQGGCCTVMPFFVGNTLQLPLTTTQDYSLFNILKSYSINLWIKTNRVDHAEAWSDHFYRPPGLHYRKKSPGYLPNPAGVCCSNAFRGKGLVRFAPGSS